MCRGLLSLPRHRSVPATSATVSKPYDATSKDLIETDPAGWVAFLGFAVDPSAVSLVDADVSTVTTDADKVIRVGRPSPWLLHLDIQARWEAAMDRRVLRYNALLHHRHGLPVASVVVVLRSASNMRALTGVLAMRPPVGAGWEFRYEVLRVWERPPTDFLGGPLGLVPLAPLADLREPDLPAVVGGMKSRIDGQPDRPLAAKLWAASYVLMGLRYERAQADNLLSGVMQMEESVTYQAILERGQQKGLQQGALTELRKVLLLQGEAKFGAPSGATTAAINAISDIVRLESLAARILTASSWDDLLQSA